MEDARPTDRCCRTPAARNAWLGSGSWVLHMEQSPEILECVNMLTLPTMLASRVTRRHLALPAEVLPVSSSTTPNQACTGTGIQFVFELLGCCEAACSRATVPHADASHAHERRRFPPYIVRGSCEQAVQTPYLVRGLVQRQAAAGSPFDVAAVCGLQPRRSFLLPRRPR